MKIKKPVVGDVVIHEGWPCIVTNVNTHALHIDVMRFITFDYYDVEVGGVEPKIECQFFILRYPAWKYPEQTDEMIEVSDE